MSKEALKKNISIKHDRGPQGLEDLIIRGRIIELLFQALTAKDIWEAMEYLMAARGLLNSRQRTAKIS